MFKGSFFAAFGPLGLISIPYQKCTGTDLPACEPDVLSSSAHPPQRSISGSFPLSGTPGKLIIFSLCFSWGAIFMVILIVKVELVKENNLCFTDLVRAFAIYSFTYLSIYESIPIFYRLCTLLHASRGSAK